MTTDITELAQRMRTAAEKLGAAQWQTRNSFSGTEVIVKGSLEKGAGCVSFQPVAADIADTKTARAIALFSPANILALVEALEKAQTINAAAEKLVRCKGRYHSELNYRALAALFGVNTPDLQPLDSESRTVTVKLPDIMPPEAAPAHYWGSGESMAYSDGYNKSAADLKTSFAQSCSSVGVNVEFE
ncbi:ead/Ea22-like family protein [Klebsiella grimontii]